MSSDKINCPFCDYKGRADHAKRHLKGHKMEDIVDLPLPNGCHFRSIDRKPYVVVCLVSEGSAKSVGYCFRCNEVIDHIAGTGRASYASHVCKPPRGGTLPPVTDFLPVVAAPVVAVPAIPVMTSTEINWEAVVKEIEADPVAKKLFDMKRIKEQRVKSEDEDDDDKVTHVVLSQKELILTVIKLDATLKRCTRLEERNEELGITNENFERSVRELTEKLIESERIKQNLNDLVNAAREENERLKHRLTPHVEIIEYSN